MTLLTLRAAFACMLLALSGVPLIMYARGRWYLVGVVMSALGIAGGLLLFLVVTVEMMP